MGDSGIEWLIWKTVGGKLCAWLIMVRAECTCIISRRRFRSCLSAPPAARYSYVVCIAAREG